MYSTFYSSASKELAETIQPEQQWNISHIDKKYNGTVKQIFYNMVPRCGCKAMIFLLFNLSKTLHFTPSKDFDQQYFVTNYHLDVWGISNTLDGLSTLKEPWIFTKLLHYINFPMYRTELNPVYINIVRDPIERLVSHYYFRREDDITKNILKYHGKVASDFFKHADEQDQLRRRNMSFDECVFTSDPECVDVRFMWNIIPHFCGQHFICLSPTRHALNLAIKNVMTSYAVVGHTDKFVEFLEVLQIMFPNYFKGATQCHWYLKQNRPNYAKETSFDAPEVGEVTREILMNNKMIQLEYEFVDFVIKRFRFIYGSYTGHSL